jgi:hypothetical protein
MFADCQPELLAVLSADFEATKSYDVDRFMKNVQQESRRLAATGHAAPASASTEDAPMA